MLSLFSGAGGLDLGLEKAGFDVRLCVEVDPVCRETLHQNRPGWKLAEPGDIHALSPRQALKLAGLKPRQLTLLAGGPPCQPFSKSSYWVAGDTARLSDPRAGTLRAYVELVEHALPEVLLLENVKGLAYTGKDEGLQLLTDALSRINKQRGTKYVPAVLHINAASYGVPQTRERVLIVAHREGTVLQQPNPTHGPLESETVQYGGAEPYTTAWDAIGDLDLDEWSEDLNPSGKWAALMPSVPEGQNYLWHTPKGGGMPLFGWRTRFWSFLLKLAKDQPSWTLQAQPGPATGPFHWKSRKLSVRELCRLQTFPDEYNIAGSYRDAQRQIGNAVPPAIGELLGLEIRRQLLGERPRRSLKLVPSRRDDCPGPEQTSPVPTTYHELCDSHADHPGHGKGPRAVRWASAQAEDLGEVECR